MPRIIKLYSDQKASQSRNLTKFKHRGSVMIRKWMKSVDKENINEFFTSVSFSKLLKSKVHALIIKNEINFASIGPQQSNS